MNEFMLRTKPELARLTVAASDPLAKFNGGIFMVMDCRDSLYTVERARRRSADEPTGLVICGLKRSELTFLGAN